MFDKSGLSLCCGLRLLEGEDKCLGFYWKNWGFSSPWRMCGSVQFVPGSRMLWPTSCHSPRLLHSLLSNSTATLLTAMPWLLKFKPFSLITETLWNFVLFEGDAKVSAEERGGIIDLSGKCFWLQLIFFSWVNKCLTNVTTWGLQSRRLNKSPEKNMHSPNNFIMPQQLTEYLHCACRMYP